MREGWNVLVKIDDDSFRVVLDGGDKADALSRAETLLVEAKKKSVWSALPGLSLLTDRI